MFLVAVLGFVAYAGAFPMDHDPFNPIGPWARFKAPCGIPSFVTKLPEDVQEKVRAIWANYKEGDECEKEHLQTREIIQSLPEELRHQIFAGRCGPSFLRKVSKTIRNEFRNVWFNHRISLDEKELALKKLAYSLLTGESLALFYKWEEELQVRKKEYEEKIAALSPNARDAFEKWKAIRMQEKEFLASLPKEIREELKTICKHYGWHKRIAEVTDRPEIETTEPETTTTQEPTTTTTVVEVMITTEEEVEAPTSTTIEETSTTPEAAPSTTTEETVAQTTPESTQIVTSEAQEKADKEFARFLDVNLPDAFTEEAECAAFY